MKTYVALVIVMTVLAVAPPLRAQQCYTPVTSWKQPTYSLSAKPNSQSIVLFRWFATVVVYPVGNWGVKIRLGSYTGSARSHSR
jgi:hypothetical protein